MRVRARLLESLDGLPREWSADEGEKGPGREARKYDAQHEDEVRGSDDPAEHGRGSRDPESNDERPLPDRRVRGDVRDLVDPQDPRHEETQRDGEDDRGGVERSREDVVRPEDRDGPAL